MSITSNLSFIENSSGAITTGTMNAIGAPITFSINNALAATIDSDRNLLINYSSSQGPYKLQVNGDALVSGNITALTATIGTLFVTNGIVYNTVFAVTTANITNIIGGNIVDNGALTVHGQALFDSGTESTTTATGAVVVAGGVGVSKNVNIGGSATVAGNVTITGNVTGGGIRTSSTSTAPLNPTVGDIWYYTPSDLIFRWTFDGTSYYWIDITGPYLSSQVGATVGKAVAMSMVFGG